MAALDDLDPRSQLALLHRILHRARFDDGTRAGHISMRLDDGTILITPHEYAWDEMRASRLARIDDTGAIVTGDAKVSAVASVLHVALHQHRSDVRVAVHNHPQWATVWAAAQRLPPVYDQLSALIRDDLVLYDNFRDNVADPDVALENVVAMDGSTTALLANHGVFVLGGSLRDAHLRCIAVEHRCRLAWRVEVIGGGRPVHGDVIEHMSTALEAIGGWPYFLEAAVRRELAADPSVLE